ncbi:helix-turn-helix domain-containing protein (plasmid) [Sphingomonadaceae bacterium OTU29MARTA1]|nr:helix-turn-helix domain-containing protein [Sphingomonadaceae bacterium OTU29MARTA1]
MTAFTLGEASARVLMRAGESLRPQPAGGSARPRRTGGVHRTGAPVLRDSIEAGTFEELFFAVPVQGEPDRMLRACRRALDAGRRLRREARAGIRILTATERAIAGLTAAAVRVYEEICTLARLNQGRVFPSYDWLAEATALGRATIARALHALDRVGFLVRQRRFKRVEGEGPRYRQTSNAYRPLLPSRVLAYLPRWMRPAPLPDDQVQHDVDRQAALAAMLSDLSCRALASVTIGGILGKALARLGSLIDDALSEDRCESHNNPQPLMNSIYQAT